VSGTDPDWLAEGLAYGGLKPSAVERLEALADQLYGGTPIMRKLRLHDRPIAGTRLIWEWQGSSTA